MTSKNRASTIQADEHDGFTEQHEGASTSDSTVALLFEPQDISMDVDPALGERAHCEGSRPSIGGAGTSTHSLSSDNIPYSELQNPSDALDILAQIASNGGHAGHSDGWRAGITGTANLSNDSNRPGDWSIGGLDYHLVRQGKLSTSKVIQLVDRYRDLYHPYFALVSPDTLDIRNLSSVARQEPHLLTAICVIASKDLIQEPDIFTSCAEYMQSLVSTLSAGGAGGVEAVCCSREIHTKPSTNARCLIQIEALLILAEWTPYTSRSSAGQVGRGEEDREAWMSIGIALRIGYYLGLDKYSFPVRDDGKDPQWRRKRLVWTCSYISDRQISIRIGRAFWSRGPGPGMSLRREDFPYQVQTPGGEDYASIFQATLELTLLFSNVHDVLYSSPGNSLRSHLTGGFYIKIVDDFRSAYYGWKSVYGTMTCKSTRQLVVNGIELTNLRLAKSQSYVVDVLRLSETIHQRVRLSCNRQTCVTSW